MKKQPTELEFFLPFAPDRRLISRTYKKVLEIRPSQIEDPKNWTAEMNRHSLEV